MIPEGAKVTPEIKCIGNCLKSKFRCNFAPACSALINLAAEDLTEPENVNEIRVAATCVGHFVKDYLTVCLINTAEVAFIDDEGMVLRIGEVTLDDYIS